VKRTYSRAWHPPAPAVSIVVRAPRRAEALTIEAQIDSGADICTLPTSVIDTLGLPRVRVVRVAGFSGLPKECIVHAADFEIEGTRLEALDVVGTARTYLLLGRNFLEHFVVKLDGPRLTLELTVQSRAKKKRSRTART
jgi:predicted aspartyl protease